MARKIRLKIIYIVERMESKGENYVQNGRICMSGGNNNG